jgi:hypothetical protein
MSQAKRAELIRVGLSWVRDVSANASSPSIFIHRCALVLVGAPSFGIQQFGRQRFGRQTSLDRRLQLVELRFKIIEGGGDALDRVDSEIAMRVFLGPQLRGAHVDDAGLRVETPPDAVREQISVLAEWKRSAELEHDGIGLRQPVGMLTLMLVAEFSHFLRPIFCRPANGGRVLAEVWVTGDDVEQLRNPLLKSSMREHHVDKCSRERHQVRVIGLRKEMLQPRDPLLRRLYGATSSAGTQSLAAGLGATGGRPIGAMKTPRATTTLGDRVAFLRAE